MTKIAASVVGFGGAQPAGCYGSGAPLATSGASTSEQGSGGRSQAAAASHPLPSKTKELTVPRTNLDQGSLANERRLRREQEAANVLPLQRSAERARTRANQIAVPPPVPELSEAAERVAALLTSTTDLKARLGLVRAELRTLTFDPHGHAIPSEDLSPQGRRYKRALRDAEAVLERDLEHAARRAAAAKASPVVVVPPDRERIAALEAEVAALRAQLAPQGA